MKRALLLVVAALATTACRNSVTPTRWEYRVASPGNMIVDLSGLGADGWELVQHIPGGANRHDLWIYKRPGS